MKKISFQLNRTRLIIILLIVLVLFTGILAALVFRETTDPEEMARASVTAGFDALKAKDFTAAGAYIQDITKASASIQENASINQEQADALMNALFAHFDYEILETERVDSATAKVKIKITNADMAPVVEAWREGLVSIATKKAKEKDEVIKAAMVDDLINRIEKAEALSDTTIKVKVVRVLNDDDENWVLKLTPEQFSSLLGGLDKAF